MAIGTNADFKIYQEQFFGGFVEVLQQNAVAFNAASRSALRLLPMLLKGDYTQESFFKNVSLIRRRDIDSTADVNDSKLEMDEFVSVKLARGIGPVAQTRDAFRKIAQDPQLMSVILGRMAAPEAAIEWLNTIVRCIVAALSGVAAVNHDASGATINHTEMVKAISKFGDAGERIICWVMHSKPYYDLVGQQIADKIFEVAGMAVRTGIPATLNRPTIVIDSSPLKVPAAGSDPDFYFTLGLTESAGKVEQSEERDIVLEPVTGKENLVDRLQGEYSYNVSVKGFKWDIANGGKNPNDAALATSTNWEKVIADDKSIAGVMLKTR